MCDIIVETMSKLQNNNRDLRITTMVKLNLNTKKIKFKMHLFICNMQLN